MHPWSPSAPLTAATIAKRAGVNDFVAECTPESKLAYIRKEQAEGKLRGEKGKKAGDLEDRIMGKVQEVQGTVREAVGRTARKLDEK